MSFNLDVFLDEKTPTPQLLEQLKHLVKLQKKNTGDFLVGLFMTRQIPYAHKQRILSLLQTSIKKSNVPVIREEYPSDEIL